MNDPVPELSAAQIKFYEVAQRIKMSWFALYALVIMFSVTLLVFFYAVLFKGALAASITGGVDATIGFVFRTVYLNLFPAPVKPPASPKVPKVR